MPQPTKGPRLGGSPAHEKLILANLAARRQVVALGLGDETLGQRAQPAGLGLRGLDPAVLEQRAGKVGQHQLLVRGAAPEAGTLGGRGHWFSLFRLKSS
jgi:hypothetical protein